MYSRNKGITDRPDTADTMAPRVILTPPPGYDGSRFKTRSDGRDDAFPMYGDGLPVPKSPSLRHRRYYSNSSRCSNRSTDRCPTDDKCLDSDNFTYCSDDGCICSSDTGCDAECDRDRCFDRERDCPHNCKHRPPKHDGNTHKGCDEGASPLSALIKGIGKEEILIIALMLILAGEKGQVDMDTILLLALLLCAG